MQTNFDDDGGAGDCIFRACQLRGHYQQAFFREKKNCTISEAEAGFD